MRKNLLISLFLCLLVNTIAAAQSYKYIYYLDINLASTKPATAVFIGKGVPDEGLVRVDYFYKNAINPLLSIHFTDSSLNTMAGLFKSFHLNGRLENEGWYKNNVEDGSWQKWDSSGNKVDSAVYSNGLRVIHKSYEYTNEGRLNSYEYLDSINDKYRFESYDSTGGIRSEATFSGKAGIYKTYDSGNVTTTPIFSRERIEAGFEGGDEGWGRYIRTNLNPEVPINNGAGQGMYQVIIKFIINKDGTVSDISSETNFGFGMEAEVIRVIKKCKKWTPAVVFGIPVKAYRRQPVTFVVSESQRSRD